jgi:formate--tetrahydrofolate ligase
MTVPHSESVMVLPSWLGVAARSGVGSVQVADLESVVELLSISPERLVFYGRDKAKMPLGLLRESRSRSAASRLVLVSAITPTPAGEGKTATAIGLADGLSALGHHACVALREPSMGPCMGIKGGGTGGGESQLVPSDAINLHFTGDFHAVAAAHNLLAAVIDNHLHFGSDVALDQRRLLWRRVVDMGDRALRRVVAGLGGTTHGLPRETGFDITASSEVMAILCLAEDHDDLRRRMGRIIVGFDRAGEPVDADRLKATGAMTALLREALMPNLVQTRHGTPAFVHGGPFANIAHGCNSVLATRMGLHLCDWVVTEAGFGFDLGAEKFYDIKCRGAGLDTAAVVLVATVRALALHGGRVENEVGGPDPLAVEAGLPNLAKHIENIARFGEPPIVALNRFANDTEEEIEIVRSFCASVGVPFAVTEHFARGPAGAAELAGLVVQHAEQTSVPFKPLYSLEDSVPEKIRRIAQSMYGARDIVFTKSASRDLTLVDRLGYARLPVCIAKTQSSLSDDPKLRGRPRDFDVTVSAIEVNAGAGFLVVATGDILRMPGLPRKPQLEHIDLQNGEIIGLR